MQAVVVKRFVTGHRMWALLAAGLVVGSMLAVALAVTLSREETAGRVVLGDGGSLQADRADFVAQLRGQPVVRAASTGPALDRADVIEQLRAAGASASPGRTVDRADAIEHLRRAAPPAVLQGRDRADAIALLRGKAGN